MKNNNNIALIVDSDPTYGAGHPFATELEVFGLTLLYATSAQAALSIIQNPENNVRLLITELNMPYAEETAPQKENFGWLLIAALRVHQPRAVVTIHSDQACQVKHMFKSLSALHIENVIQKGLLQAPIEAKQFFAPNGIPLHLSTQQAFAQYHGETCLKGKHPFSNELAPIELFVLEFSAVRKLIPLGMRKGTGLLRGNGAPFSNEFIKSKIFAVRKLLGEAIPELKIDKNTSPEKLLRVLTDNRALATNKNHKIYQYREAISYVAGGADIGKVAAGSDISKRTLTRKIKEIFDENFEEPNTGPNKVNTKKRAIAIFERFFMFD